MNRIFVEAKFVFEVTDNWIDPSYQGEVDWFYQVLKDNTSLYNTAVGDHVSKGSVEVINLTVYHTTKLERSGSAE